MRKLGAMMAGGGSSRQENDWYPTPKEVTFALLKHHKTVFPRKIWEPCAGNGAMAKILIKKDFLVYQSDIKPRHKKVATLDFFATTKMFKNSRCIITNPPFNVAEQFIYHAFAIGCEQMALLLKSTYWHAKRRQKLFKQHRPAIIMPLTWRPDFLGLGRPTMEAMWCVWLSPCSRKTLYKPINKN